MSSEIDLSEKSVIEEACKATGLSDFGSDDFRAGLRALLETYDRNDFNESGRRSGRRRVIGLLATRLRVQAVFRKHPEILERPIAHPMVLTGLPRSGTSALFNLLATDSAARPLLLWETQFPDPMEGLDPGQSDPRRDALEAYYAKSREQNPEFTKVHFASADTPEECVLLQAYAFNGVQLGIEVMMEPYGSWFQHQDLQAFYAYYRNLLQLLDWQRPGERWLLKAPAHMWAIDALIETFPDVSIVWSHRDPRLCIASICSMTLLLMKKRENLDPQQLGPIVMEFYARSLDRGLASRERHDPARFIDVTHDDFVADSIREVERIHGHFGLSLEAATREALQQHIDANPKGKHGKHEYSLEQFGLDSKLVERRFADYIERFGISLDGGSR